MFASALDLFLNKGWIQCNRQISGHPKSKTHCARSMIGCSSATRQPRRTRAEMRSGPVALASSNDFKILRTWRRLIRGRRPCDATTALCTPLVHAPCARPLRTPLVHGPCARPLCTALVHGPCTRPLCTPLFCFFLFYLQAQHQCSNTSTEKRGLRNGSTK